jgi:acetyltransferase-like isoleucine patch superfamily enzyme
MFAVRVKVGRPLAPFGDSVGDVPVLNRALKEAQELALVAAGFTLAAEAPASGAYLCYGDCTWFTEALLRRFSEGGPGRLRVDDVDFLRETGPLQPERGRYFLEIRASGRPVGFDGDDRTLDLALRHTPPQVTHPAFAHAIRGSVALGPCLVHELWHWSHITRVNLLALAAEAERARADWERGGIFTRLGMLLPVLWRARSVQPAALARALLPIPKSARIHPTAVVEACIIGEGVEIGPFACVRGSVLGEGCKVDAYANVNLSVIGPKAQAGRGAMINLCVLYAGAFVSAGGGFQMCVFGRDSFVAMTATMLDLSFGRTIHVDTPEGRMDTEGYFLGSALGHGAKLGAGVRIGYGVAVPNDVLLVAPTGDLVRKIIPGEPGQALTATDGVARARQA